MASMQPDPKSLAEAIDLYQEHLKDAGDLYSFDISGLDRIGIPVKIAALRSPDGFWNDGFGYGGSADEALVGALGEMTETYHTHRALQRTPAAEGLSYAAMVKKFGADHVIDPLTLCLSAGYPYHSELPLRWVAVSRYPDGGRCWAPRETVAPSGASYATNSEQVAAETGQQAAQLFPAITCGLGAGRDLSSALAHGVLELIQRDGNCTAFRAMDCGIDLQLDEVGSDEILKTISFLESQGLRIRPKLASTEFGLVNLYVIAEPLDPSAYDEPFPLLATACGEAVHANRERALRKALQEYLGSRCRKCFMHGPLDRIERIVPPAYRQLIEAVDPAEEEPRALEEMVGWLQRSVPELRRMLRDTVFSSRETVSFSQLPSASDTDLVDPGARLKDVATRLASQDLSIYYLDASPVGDDGPRVVKAFTPGLEGETLSYWRIGERGARRMLAREVAFVTQKPPSCQSLEVLLSPAAKERLGGPVYFQTMPWEQALRDHYPLYREPSSHAAAKRLAQR